MDLKYNKSKNVKKSWFNNKVKLSILSLSYNEIDDIDDDAFDGFNSLTELYLNNNKLKNV